MNFQGNWVDLVIIVLVLVSGIHGMQTGFLTMLSRVLSFIGSLIIALGLYGPVSRILATSFTLSSSIAKAIAFLSVAFLAEALIGLLMAATLTHFPRHYIKHWWSKPLGLAVGIIQSLVIISFVVSLILAFPIKPSIKRDISRSVIAGELIRHTDALERGINAVFGEAVEDTLTYLTIKSDSSERVDLDSEVTILTVDEVSEADMVRLVNQEREKVGLSSLTVRPELIPIARSHAMDMWDRKYFAHISPEGEDVGNRLNEQSVSYLLAGENLALAPTLITAHVGLMNSEGHRKNILEPGFTQIGIGVIDNQMYGKMFVQIFTD